MCLMCEVGQNGIGTPYSFPHIKQCPCPLQEKERCPLPSVCSEREKKVMKTRGKGEERDEVEFLD